MKPTLGIIGGAGPLATLDIEQKIFAAVQKLTYPLTDQDYFNLVVFNYCETYDRNDSIFFDKLDPITQYIKYVTSISTLGVDLILVACNTAHIYLNLLKEKTHVPIISIIDKTVDYLRIQFPSCTKVGLISTKATQEKKLYHDLLSQYCIEIVDITSLTQHLIMEAIYLIKAGTALNHREMFLENVERSSNINIGKSKVLKAHPYKYVLLQKKVPNPTYIIREAIKELKSKGCQHIILGCTELPLVLPYLNEQEDVNFIDPNDIIAQAIVKTLQGFEKQMFQDPILLNNEGRHA